MSDQVMNGDVKLIPPPSPSGFDWFCETLQIVNLGAPIIPVWVASNYPQYTILAAGICGAASFIAGRYLKLCTPYIATDAEISSAVAKSQPTNVNADIAVVGTSTPSHLGGVKS